MLKLYIGMGIHDRVKAYIRNGWENNEELELELRYDEINIYDVITRTLFMM